MEPPQNPVGEFVKEESCDSTRVAELIAQIESAPAALRKAVAGLSDPQLDTKYRNWSIRQIVHHLADSHINSYIRFKWALTEDLPTIKAYFEDRWVALEDSRTGAIDEPLALFDAIHARWVQLLRTMTMADFERSFIHPETGQTVSLKSALCYYPWHSRHHTGQIGWLREQHGW
ncbi:MAG: putative metal-dependent hydrolase [Bythopirellula sp.]|nr:putative metal-dependent hydrolase [Bythopirellula sp.]